MQRVLDKDLLHDVRAESTMLTCLAELVNLNVRLSELARPFHHDCSKGFMFFSSLSLVFVELSFDRDKLCFSYHALVDSLHSLFSVVKLLSNFKATVDVLDDALL